MTGPLCPSAQRSTDHVLRRPGYTLVEILVSTVLTLMVLGAVVQVFGTISTSISDARKLVEKTDQLRSATLQLKRDLEGVTVTMSPPRSPEAGEGYFQYTEGPHVALNANNASTYHAANIDLSEVDSTVGDNDDVLLFTTQSSAEPFLGRGYYKDRVRTGEIADGSDGNGAYKERWNLESPVAEVAWFVRGRTLYRRMLLVYPQLDIDVRTAAIDYPLAAAGGRSYYGNYDVSARLNGTVVVPNTLGDLSKPENRYAAVPPSGIHLLPYHPHCQTGWTVLGLPLLPETAGSAWTFGTLPAATLTLQTTPYDKFDAWTNPYPYTELHHASSPQTEGLHSNYVVTDQPRLGEDVILTNVVGFDVKAWDPTSRIVASNNVALMPGDPGYPADYSWAASTAESRILALTTVGYGGYVDLGYARTSGTTSLSDFSETNPDARPNNVSYSYFPVRGTNDAVGGVYDTWSNHYERDGVNQDGDALTDEGTDGFDNDTTGVTGIVDDDGEAETAPPYRKPLRGIQVKIRVYEPDSRQVREVTVVQDFSCR